MGICRCIRDSILLLVFTVALLSTSGAWAAFKEKWPKVYLASFPRSGNHWIRYLIEEATHIATSSVYCDPDPPHLSQLFPWRGFCCLGGYDGRCRYPYEDEPVVLKTHYPVYGAQFGDCRPYVKAICLIRHPIDSVYSHYLYLNSGSPPSAHIPDEELRDYLLSWRNFHRYWQKKATTLMIRYEDLYHTPAEELKKILKAIGYPFKDKDVTRAVAAYPPEGVLFKHLSHYSAEDLEMFQQLLEDDIANYKYSIPQR